MSLYEAMMTDFRFMEKVRVPDKMGGWNTEWADGEIFKAAIIKDSSLQARIAEKSDVTELYTITTYRKVPLEFHDVVKRLSDGAIFRITSNAKDNASPVFSGIDFHQVNAEAWELE